MIKYHTISKYIGTTTNNLEAYNKEVKEFIENISIEGHTFVSCVTISHGQDMNRLRTEIIYRENQTRKVIVEKASS
jgi:hypothetical protein